MKNLIHGQSKLDDKCGISLDVKSVGDIDIDDINRMIKDREEIEKQRREKINAAYYERMAKKHAPYDGYTTYNLRVLNYPHGQQLTYYNNPIALNSKSEKCTRSYKNADRTEAEEQHCIDVSLNRTKNTIYNIARSHSWNWFVTFTFNRHKSDASDFDEVVKKMRRNINNTIQRRCPNMKYIIVPELHADGVNYHFHGLFADCDELQFTFSGRFDKNGRPIFNIPSWSWGFSTATLVGDSASASSYITKYITKDTEHYLKGRRRYLSNAKKTEAQKVNVENSLNDIVTQLGDDIQYIKQEHVKDAYRICTYIELPPDTMEIAYE